jgi:biopolymer transport protein ExbD
MAELEQKEVGKKGKKKGRKKMSTRIDLTPMVDLGFLLVTFFMLTTTFSKPQTMEINMPVKPKEPIDIKSEDPENKVKASKAITILIGADNSLFWYHGLANEPLEGPKRTNFSADGVRKMLIEKNSQIQDMVVLIKPTDEASYKNVVDILDEMNISNIKRYAIVDLDPIDKDIVRSL